MLRLPSISGRSPRRRPMSMRVALVVAIGLAVVAVLAPWIQPRNPAGIDMSRSLLGPSMKNPLGTDALGRDVLSRLIFATRVTVVALLQGLGIALVLGLPAGLISGYLRGPVDAVVSRFSEAFQALPPLVLAMGIVAALGPGLTNAMIAVGIVLAPRFFRVARGAALTISALGYMEALEADGYRRSRLLWRHVLPNASGPLLAQISFTVGVVIQTEASLSFLGLGVRPPDASWGSMIRSAFDDIKEHPFELLPPTLTVVITALAMFHLADWFSDRAASQLADA